MILPSTTLQKWSLKPKRSEKLLETQPKLLEKFSTPQQGEEALSSGLTPQARVIERFFKIPNKQGQVVSYALNPTQRLYNQNQTNRDVIDKARQEGISSQVLAEFTVDCAVYDYVRAVVISHDAESTQRLLAKVHFYIENLRDGLKFKTRYSTKNEIVFLNTGSTFYIGTAGARKFGRGDTISRLHCSEVAFWDKPDELVAGLFQAVPREGRIVLESTANGIGNFFHRTVQQALTGQGRFRLHFFPWSIFPEYSLPVQTDFDLTEEEVNLVHDFNLSPGQLLWRREKLLEFEQIGRPELFKQEYPLTVEESFLASGWGFFPEAKIIPKQPVEVFGNWKVWKQPEAGRSYSLGIDTAAGVGKDDSVVEICEEGTYEQVAEFVSERTSPDVLANEAMHMGRRYNTALAVIEMNSYGLEVLNQFKRDYPNHTIYQRRRPERTLYTELQFDTYGWISSQRSKMLLATDLRVALREGLIVHSEYCVDELKSFIEDEDKRLRAQEGCKDDCVIALGLAVQGLRYLPSIQVAKPLEHRENGITLNKMRKYMKTLHRPGQAMMDGDYFVWLS